MRQRMTQSRSVKALLLVVLASCALALLPVRAYADEITPDSSSYVYGATSEFSPSATVSGGSDSLANTGINQALPLIVGMMLLFSGSALAYIAVRHYRAHGSQSNSRV